MKQSIVFTLLTSLTAVVSSQVVGQDKSHSALLPSADSSSRMVTGDTLDGVKYYIKIVPVDTTHEERMPTYTPDEFVPVDRQPVPIKQVQPVYPKIGHDIEGTVWIKCLIGKDGTVKDTRVMRADAKILIEPAVVAAKQWRFTPAQVHGKSVAVWAAIPFRFRIKR